MMIKNIALSGWSGAGTTTTTLLLAVLLKRRYFPITQIFRTIGAQVLLMHSTQDESGLANAEKVIQPLIGKMVDEFVDYLLLNESGIVLESDLSVFRIGKHPQIFSIFLLSSYQTRSIRFFADGRVGDDETLLNRDKALRDEYKKLWNIDIFDDYLINQKFNLVLDNNHITLSESVRQILAAYGQHIQDENEKELVSEVLNEVDSLVKDYTVQGKKLLIEFLQQANLYVPVEKMLKMLYEHNEDEILTLPEQYRQVFTLSLHNS